MARWLAAAATAAALAGCAGTLPPAAERPPSLTWVAPSGSPVADIAARADIAAGTTGAWPLPQAAFDLDARLAAMAHATRSIDVQTYLLADDGIGRLVLHALKQAASRGVRVRLLLDDLYTTGLDPLLLGLAAYPNVEVRLFNPFVHGRTSSFGRLLALAGDFRRLDHRMHNKLFVVDGRLAIVGGRNLADEYFLRGKVGNFIDFDLLLVGAVLPSLAAIFDAYWNSAEAYDVHQIAHASGSPATEAADPKQEFERRTATVAIPAPPERDLFGVAPLSVQFETAQFRFVPVFASSAYADSPDKGRSARGSDKDTLARRFLDRLGEAQSEIVLLSPYFIPDKAVVEHLGLLRARGVSVRIVTNSLAVSDEPFVTVALARHQRELLAMGVELYELSSDRLKLERDLRTLFGASIGRLHAKVAVVDRQFVYVGSLNLDGRSARINTEIGVRIESATLADMTFRALRIDEATGVYRVKLMPDGSLGWSVLDADRNEVILSEEPDASWWHRLRVRLLSLLVPEDEL
jgi:phosphatidylserine/phosphatidylglycerophosphate/cardiolipin synthase-like enzyme